MNTQDQIEIRLIALGVSTKQARVVAKFLETTGNNMRRWAILSRFMPPGAALSMMADLGYIRQITPSYWKGKEHGTTN